MKDADRPVAIASIAEDRGARLAAIDAVRGAAIAAMVVYHTAFDLSVRRLIPVDVTSNPGWVVFARLIAGTFLALVGVGLVLATRRGLNLDVVPSTPRAGRRRGAAGQSRDLVG